MMPLGVTFIQETTVFREFGPLAGSTMRRQLRGRAEDRRATLSRQTIDVDARKYFRLGGSGLLALRAQGLQELGREPGLLVFRRQLRDARLRLPVVRRTGRVLPERRTALPADRGDGDADRHPRRHPRHVVRQPRAARASTTEAFKVWTNDTTIETPLIGSQIVPAERPARSRPGLRPAARSSTASACVDARASYGISLQTFALGFPVHFDWSWKTLFNKDWEDVVFALAGRQQRVPQAEVHDVDRLRLLDRLRCRLTKVSRHRRHGNETGQLRPSCATDRVAYGARSERWQLRLPMTAPRLPGASISSGGTAFGLPVLRPVTRTSGSASAGQLALAGS